jgi:hypothetical protein
MESWKGPKRLRRRKKEEERKGMSCGEAIYGCMTE